MRMNERLMIYWILDDIKDDFNIESNERVMTIISTDIMLTMMNSWTLRILSMTFTLNILIKRTEKIHSCKHELLKKRSNVMILYSWLYSWLYSQSTQLSLVSIWVKSNVIESLHHLCKTSTLSSLAQRLETHI